jgi:hypothetical protein
MNMFYSSQNTRLFRKHDLGAVMRAQIEALEKEIKNISHEVLSQKKDAEIIESLSPKYSIYVPMLKLDEMKVSPEEAEIQVRDDFFSRHEDGLVTVNGFRITVTIPFIGDKDTFHMQPSTMSMSGTPSPTLTENSLVFTYETREKDPEKIKALWNSDIKDIQQNLDWINRDVSSYNSSLENIIQERLNQRRKDADSNKALFEQLKN